MVILSTLRYGETAYGSATKMAMRTWDPVHHKWFRLAHGAFAIWKTLRGRSTDTFRNERIEFGKCGIKIITNVSHLIRHFFCDTKIHDDYILQTNTPTTIFTRTIRKYNNNIDTRKIKTTLTHSQAPWSMDTNETLDFNLRYITKKASTVQIRAEYTARMEQVRIFQRR
jgi:hypothetical protein